MTQKRVFKTGTKLETSLFSLASDEPNLAARVNQRWLESESLGEDFWGCLPASQVP